MNLDFYLDNNGKVKYNKDIAATQYSSNEIIRIFTKKQYQLIILNTTLGNNITLPQVSMFAEARENGYNIYSYKMTTKMTGYYFTGSQSIIKISFTLYENKDDLNTYDTTSICYIPLLASTKPAGYDDSITTDAYQELSTKVNELANDIINITGGTGTAEYYSDNGTRKRISDSFNTVNNNINNLDIRVSKN